MIQSSLPARETTPQMHHTIKHNPTDPVFVRTPFGDTKIPEPKIML